MNEKIQWWIRLKIISTSFVWTCEEKYHDECHDNDNTRITISFDSEC
jgi:hypothetical protein